MLEDGPFPAGRFVPLETEEYAGLLQEFAGELQITQIISPQALSDIDIAFFACGPEIMKAYLTSGASFPELTIDLTQCGKAGTLYLNGVTDPAVLGGRGYFVSPHPAAIVLGRLLSLLDRVCGIEWSVVTLLEPASERGSGAVDELQSQTVSLLNFQEFEKKIFRGQLAFNLLPEPEASARTESLVGEQLAVLLGKDVPLPSITAIQAPVFHSHSYSVCIQCRTEADSGEIWKALQGDPAFQLHEDATEISPVTIVGNDRIHVGRVRAASGRALSLWLASDNLRIAASNAIRLAESIMFRAIVH
jgi:aspartate-semialdehyde dehydrogenase